MRPGVGAAESEGEGYVVVVDPPASGARLRVVGERAEGACPLALVLPANAVLGEEGRRARMNGAVIACGALEVDGQTSLRGHLFARGLTVNAPLTIAVPSDWRRQTLAGLTEPVIVTIGHS